MRSKTQKKWSKPAPKNEVLETQVASSAPGEVHVSQSDEDDSAPRGQYLRREKIRQLQQAKMHQMLRKGQVRSENRNAVQPQRNRHLPTDSSEIPLISTGTNFKYQ